MRYPEKQPAPDSSSSESSNDDTVQSFSDFDTDQDSCIPSESEIESDALSPESERENETFLPVSTNQNTGLDSVNSDVFAEQTTDT